MFLNYIKCDVPGCNVIEESAEVPKNWGTLTNIENNLRLSQLKGPSKIRHICPKCMREKLSLSNND